MSTFSKRHYEAIATVLADRRAEVGAMQGELAVITIRLARMFKADNPAFEARRFGIASGALRSEDQPLDDLDAWRVKHIGVASNVVRSSSRKAERQK